MRVDIFFCGLSLLLFAFFFGLWKWKPFSSDGQTLVDYETAVLRELNQMNERTNKIQKKKKIFFYVLFIVGGKLWRMVIATTATAIVQNDSALVNSRCNNLIRFTLTRATFMCICASFGFMSEKFRIQCWKAAFVCVCRLSSVVRHTSKLKETNK